MATRTWTGAVSGAWGTAGNWAESAVPTTADIVRIPATATVDIVGSDQTAVVLGAVLVEKGCPIAIGSASANLQIKTDRFEFEGTGVCYFNLSSNSVSPQVFGTAAASTGQRGLYLIGTAIATLNVVSGSVGVAVRSGEVSTVTTVRVVGADASVWCGAGVTLTTFYQTDGDSEIRCAATTVTTYGGSLRSREVGAITTWSAYGGSSFPESSGTIGTLLVQGGEVDMTLSGVARTVSTLKMNPAGASILKYNPAVVTVSARSAPDYPVTETVLAA